MKNTKINKDLQLQIKNFVMSTQGNQDHQDEVNEFMILMPPSVRKEIQQWMFFSAVNRNKIFGKNSDLFEFVVDDISTLLYHPEDDICV